MVCGDLRPGVSLSGVLLHHSAVKKQPYNQTLQRLGHLPLGGGRIINPHFFRILPNRTRVLNAENRAYFMCVCLQFFVELNERRL